MATRDEVKEVASDVARWWWIWLVAGIAWIFVAMIILQLDAASVRTVGFIVGAMLFVAGIQYLLIAMFAEGWGAQGDNFDTGSEGYRLLQDLAELRASDTLFTDGELDVLAGETAGPGLLAYRRAHEGRSALVLINSADHGILVHELPTGLEPATRLEALWTEQPTEDLGTLSTDGAGRLSRELPARAAGVLRPAGPADRTDVSGTSVTIQLDAPPENQTLTEDTHLSGQTSPDVTLQVIPDGNLDRAQVIQADADGQFSLVLPVRDLGEAERTVQLRDPESGAVSERIT